MSKYPAAASNKPVAEDLAATIKAIKFRTYLTVYPVNAYILDFSGVILMDFFTFKANNLKFNMLIMIP